MPLQLLSLPPEILVAMVDHLAPSQADFDKFSDGFKPDISLYRLAQTCTVFRDICVPRLYDICSIKTGANLRRSLCIIRTLIARPEIAKRVKRIIISASLFPKGYRESEIIISTEEAALFNHVLRRGLKMTAAAPLSKVVAGDRMEYQSISESLVCVALTLTPNITSVILLSRSNRMFGSPPEYIPADFQADYFPLLETFSVQNASTDPATAFDKAIGMLPHAAPRVRRLFGWGIDQLPETAYPYVKQVVLGRSRLSSTEMERLPRVFPNLERFTYVDVGPTISRMPDKAAPPVIFEALLALRKTLSHVELGKHIWLTRRASSFTSVRRPPNEVLKSLAQMEVLESLTLPTSFIYAALEEADGPDHLHAERKLAQFLPRSIRSLYLEDVQESDEADLLALAQAAPRQFPNLAQVRFATWSPLEQLPFKDVVRPAFEMRKIKCRFEVVNGGNYMSAFASVPEHWK
ncbi:hypothetical protein ISF_07911 [Cordyceps fumosorosea ARSEF 2679]|uniref:F-box domain-containing protein n=1 Tax=Cordyceps fumosorosea (strain ARSEF 2679) TaxID=1081104 RepID=A0A162MFC8_CORFA|nr:hypothetical protein ISF_07911 [Cordyceps fumosorosea ARSEF 2679]OAA55400.1 hypothetical protein ISF_07911 [Cordyceps fumosorosea ARSEF 2679]